MISYAQNFEDVILRRVFRDRKDGFYIDVGAWDPLIDSVTKSFYDAGWYGINIEPSECFYNKLLEERPRDINLNLAIGQREESRPLYVFGQHGHSTFDESSRDHFLNLGYQVEQKTVRITTLAAVCRDFVRRQIDFLKIDCEGWEKFALEGADWDRFRPTVLVVEATAPGTSTPAWSDWEPHLIETARYEFAYFDGLNRFYVPREHSNLRSCFEVPPNVFDDFKLYATDKAEQENQALAQQRDDFAWRMGILEQERDSALAENQRLAESFRTKEEQLKTELQAQKRELEAQVCRASARIAELEKERCELNEKLQKTRLWVGQLSQDLAAARLK